MQFTNDAPVVTADGHDVGRLDRVVIDPRTKAVTHLVVTEGWLFTESKVIPVDLVVSAINDKVTLRENKDALPEFPPFEETHYITPDDESLAHGARPVYGYPPMGATWWWGGYPSYIGVPGAYAGMPYAPNAQVEVERNIPDDAVALNEGATVHTASGDNAGKVERVVTEGTSRLATHLVVSSGWLFKERKVIPVGWIQEAAEGDVWLSVPTRVVERLPDYEPEG